MRLLFSLCAIASATLASANVAPSASLDGVRALVKRQLPEHAHSFDFEHISGTGDEFVVSDSRGREGGISIGCTTPSACARGLYTYLTERGNTDIWLTGSSFHRLPSRLPRVGSHPIRAASIVKTRYYFNTVTFSYTTVWYNFEQWSTLLDYMALRGINHALAWVGYESILLSVLREAGLSDSEISPFFSDSAFQSWNRFGNIQGSWDGGLPEAWINDQFALQKQIVKRMGELSITPILPAFTGFVPKALHEKYPNASIVTGSQWTGFPSNITEDSFLEPFDPLYATLQKAFLAKQQEAYGPNVSHVYTLDQYNENSPFQGDLDYLRNVSLNTFKSIRAADPLGIWCMQGWLFFSDSAFWNIDRIEAYLGGVPTDGMMVLDLYSEAEPQWQRTNSYFGKDWVWCQLHSFGGNQGFEGHLENLTIAPLAALNSPGSSMNGLGLTMEGQEGNEIVYGLLLDQAWSRTAIDISKYISSWVARRYNVKYLPDATQQAWKILGASVYNNTDRNTQTTVKSILELSPSLTGLVNRTGHHATTMFYDTNTTVLRALELLVHASKENRALRDIPEFTYDIVDLTRQVLVDRFLDHYINLLAAYNHTKATADTVTAAGRPLLAIISDLDKVLKTNKHFLLSTWISDARRWADKHHDKDYGKYLEYNARDQISLWGANGEINDYASKQWAGIVGTYYYQRWDAFIHYLAETKREGKPYNNTQVAQDMLNIGKEWVLETFGHRKGETWGTAGNSYEIVDEILKKWA